jgi:hypothetical protein
VIHDHDVSRALRELRGHSDFKVQQASTKLCERVDEAITKVNELSEKVGGPVQD